MNSETYDLIDLEQEVEQLRREVWMWKLVCGWMAYTEVDEWVNLGVYSDDYTFCYAGITAGNIRAVRKLIDYKTPSKAEEGLE